VFNNSCPLVPDTRAGQFPMLHSIAGAISHWHVADFTD